jgi:soluble lytic murein transglycosylase-like protein
MAGHHISSGNGALDALVQDAAARFGLDPCLIISVMRAESGFNRLAVSPKGASGLMQLIPATAARFGVRNIFDPRENILGGSAYLRWLLERFDGDVRLALAGYNAGEGAVEVYGNRIPPFLETQNYVRTIYSRYSTLHQGRVAQQPAQAARPAILRAPPPQPGEAFPTYNQVIRFTSSNGDKSGK